MSRAVGEQLDRVGPKFRGLVFHIVSRAGFEIGIGREGAREEILTAGDLAQYPQPWGSLVTTLTDCAFGDS